MISSLPNDRPFFSSFGHTPPRDSFVKLANKYARQRNGGPIDRCFFAQKLGPNLSEMEVRTF